jgi:hypothetical protein
LGRFISRDPSEEEEGDNLYSYVLNNPEVAVDPSGHGALSIIFRLSVCIVLFVLCVKYRMDSACLLDFASNSLAREVGAVSAVAVAALPVSQELKSATSPFGTSYCESHLVREIAYQCSFSK